MKLPGVGVRTRRMTAADLERVIEIAESLPEAPHWPRASYLDMVRPSAVVPRMALVAIEPTPATIESATGAIESGASTTESAASAIRGFAVASLLPPQAELETIAVLARHQRHGLGRLLLNALIQELRQAGTGELRLEVRASNLAAIGFYRSAGFSEIGRRARYYADPIEDAILMNLSIL